LADVAEVEAALGRIEAELLARYPDLPEPTAEQIARGGAFGGQTMAFVQWLRFVFVPAVKARLADGDLPATSEVGAYAVRELDGDPRASTLVALLSDFDALF
jgi:uncharacterized protein YqcC (DUF446 family)